jgi:hypothetical protein
MSRFTGIVAALLMAAALLPASCRAEGKVVIISLNRTSLQQVAGDESLSPWLARGAGALLNVNTAVRIGSEHVYVTLGAGSRAAGTANTRMAFNSDEEWLGAEAREIFIRNQGFHPTGRVLHMAQAEISRANRTLQYPVAPGLLGDTLRLGGKVSAVLGNADGQLHSREAVTLLMDSSGQVDYGDVSKALQQRDILFPFGWRMDGNALWHAFSEIFTIADVILVDWGDTARLDEILPQFRDNVAAGLRQKIFNDVAQFLNRVETIRTEEDMIIILAPVPPAGESGAGQLSYIFVIGDQFPGGSLLSSPSTRRPGIVAGIDLAPSILAQTGLDIPGNMLGLPVDTAGRGSTDDLLLLQTHIDRIFRLRPSLLKTYIFLQIVIILGALLNLFVRFTRMRYFDSPLMMLLLAPLVLLYLPLQSLTLVWGFAVTAAALIASVFFLSILFRHPVQKLAVVGLATALSLGLDLLRGAPLMKNSVFGYDPVSGARFYGLGNEYMGILVGASVLGVTALISLLPGMRKRLLPAATVFFLALVFLIMSPSGGANFGGTLTALAAFLVTLHILWRIRATLKSTVFLLLGLTGIACFVVLLNLQIPESAQSHLGRTLSLFGRDGWQVLTDIVARKAAMNIKLFRYSMWSRAFLAFLTVLAVLFYRPQGVLQDVQRRYTVLSAGFLGIIAGSVTAFLVNDSGVVAAATTLLFAGVPIILFAGRISEKMN